MNCWARFCNYINMLFIPDIPSSEQSIMRDLQSVGFIPEDEKKV